MISQEMYRMKPVDYLHQFPRPNPSFKSEFLENQIERVIRNQGNPTHSIDLNRYKVNENELQNVSSGQELVNLEV